jgi:hypothetical protein
MPQYVEKIRVPVRLSAAGVGDLEGEVEVALAAHAAFRDGPETLLELLNSPLRVIPFLREAQDDVVLVSRDAIDWLSADPSLEPSWIMPPAYRLTREERVEVVFLDGHKATGNIPMELPEHLNRASDFLNGSEDFFALVTKDITLLVNKARVAGVRLFQGSPKPLEIR